MAKKFDMTKLKRGKDLGDAAYDIENISDNTVDALDDLFGSPRKEALTRAVVAVKKDTQLKDADKTKLISLLRSQFIDLFNFKNCPEDYETLKLESVFLSELTQQSFLLLGQRLMKIRDNQLYRIDGYNDFKAFVEEEIKISRSTAYNYIDLVSLFGVQTFGHKNSPDASKLIPLIPILKSNREDIPSEKIKSQFLESAKTKSAREMKDDAQKIKIKYGLASEAEEIDRIDKAFNSLMNSLPEKLAAADKKKIRNYINKLNALLK